MRYQYFCCNNGKILVLKTFSVKKYSKSTLERFAQQLLALQHATKNNRKLMLPVMNEWIKFTLSWKKVIPLIVVTI